MNPEQNRAPGDTLVRVRQLIVDVLGAPIEHVDMATSHEDIPAWDSLNIVKLAMAIEAEFMTAVTPDDAVNLTSVKAIVDMLHDKGVR